MGEDEDRLSVCREKYAELAGRLAGIGYIMEGSVVERRTACGTASCACHGDPPRLHGPYWQWTTKKNGKTITRRLTAGQVPLYREWAANSRELRAILAEMRAVAADAQQVLLRQAEAGNG
jgi:hypothetical protein